MAGSPSLSSHASKPRISSRSLETMSASCAQGSGFQRLREAVSEANPRKRGFPYDSTPTQTSVNNESGLEEHDCEYGKERSLNSTSKRSRLIDWPLKNTTESPLDGRPSPPSSRGKASSSRGRDGRRKANIRLSKFQEGSLNDKPSKKPPHAFLGLEDAMEQYHTGGAANEGKHHAVYDAGVEEARPLSVSRLGRFGKAVASVFNGFWKEKEAPVLAPKDASVIDRKTKAEDAYALLKINGFRGTRPTLAHCHGEESLIKSIDSKRCQGQSFRDSAVDMDEPQRTSLQTAHTQYPSEALKPPSYKRSKRSASPASGLRPDHRSSSLHLQTPSFQSLKKVKSQIHLPTSLRQTEAVSPLPMAHDQSENRSTSQRLRRQPSKKGLAKHQRLSKKVSDLESKLDIARRELEESLHEAPPVPEVPAYLGHKPFVPGALASLPSERLLTPQISTTPAAHPTTEGDGSALVSSASTILSSPSRQLGHELSKSINDEPASNDERFEALMSSDPIARPDIDGVDYSSWTTAQVAKNKRRLTRCSSGPQLSIDGKVTAGIQKRQSSVSSISKGPKTSPVDKGEAALPVPAISITADDANKPRPASVYFARPGAASPVRTRSKTKKRGISPPPSSLSSVSKKKQCFTFLDDENDTALTPDSAAGNRQKKSVAKGSPAPKAIQMKAARAKALKAEGALNKRTEKPLPEIQDRDESFEWDEDVF